MSTELINGKTLREIAEMPMMEARKFMRESGHRWFGGAPEPEKNEEPSSERIVWMPYRD